ncbi:MAG: hypothetical protein IJ800_04155, partial [Clostridia bacterium]|nr:hypothetical protein [Clostridia bacterium]
MAKIKRILVATLAVFALAFAFTACKGPRNQSETGSTNAGDTYYTVTLSVEGYNSVEVYVKSGESLSDYEIPNFEKDGYDVVWQLDGASYDATSAVTGDITLTGVWVYAYAPYTVTVLEEGLDGEYAATDAYDFGTLEAKIGSTVDLSEKAEDKAAYGFEVSEGSVLSGEVKEDGSLALTVKYARKTYTVTYLNGEETIKTESVKYGKTASGATVEHDENEWKLAWEKGGATYDLTTPVTEDITLTAKLVSVISGYSISVEAENKDGTFSDVTDSYATEIAAMGELKGKIGTSVSIENGVSAYVPEGFEVSQGSVLSGEIQENNGLTLTVKLARKSYTVTYYSYDEETVLGSEKVKYQLNAVSHNAYVPAYDEENAPNTLFEKWTENGNDATFEEVTADKKIVAKAYDEDHTFNITLTAHGDKTVEVLEVPVGEYPEYTGGILDKYTDETGEYFYTGFPAFARATKDATYTANYTSLIGLTRGAINGNNGIWWDADQQAYGYKATTSTKWENRFAFDNPLIGGNNALYDVESYSAIIMQVKFGEGFTPGNDFNTTNNFTKNDSVSSTITYYDAQNNPVEPSSLVAGEWYTAVADLGYVWKGKTHD